MKNNWCHRWPMIEIGQVLQYEQPTKYIVKSTKYNEHYRIPVLTAGKSFIIGYTNEQEGIFTNAPVIIFDDFTTSTQYVDFSFKVKSSAMKILLPDEEKANVKFLYYLMQIIQCDHDTHKRYWISVYSKIKIPLPPLTEQERIVAKIEELFSELDRGIQALQNAKAQLKVYRQAVLKDTFCCINKKVPLSECTELITSGSRGWAKFYSENGAQFIRIGNLRRSGIEIDTTNIQRVMLPKDVEGSRCLLQKGDILVSITADLGSIGYLKNDIEESYINQHIALVRLKDIDQSNLIAWYLRSDAGQKELLKNKRGAGKLGLGLDDIRITTVPNISDEEANNILEKIESHLSVCDKMEQTIEVSLQKAESLRQSILKQAFEGKLV